MATRDFTYQGETYSVPSVLSDEEAKEVIDKTLKQFAEPETKRVTKERTIDPTVESEGLGQEIAEGVASGALNIVQGLGELGLGAIDLVADTDYARYATEGIPDLKERFGIDPVGFAGKGAEIISQFVVPGGVAVNVVSKASKLGRLSNALKKGRAVAGQTKLTKAQLAGLRGQQAGAALVADGVVSSDGTTTIGDFVEGGPTMTDQSVGLSGRDEALRLFENKLKLGAEAGAITFGLPYALTATGTALSPAAKVAGKVAGAAVLGTGDVLSNISKAAGNTSVGDGIRAMVNKPLPRSVGRLLTGDPDSTAGDVFKGVQARFRFRGNLSEEGAEAQAQIRSFTDKYAFRTAKIVKDAETSIKKAFDEAKKSQTSAHLNDVTVDGLTRTEVMNSLYSFLVKEPEYIGQAARAFNREAPGNVRFNRDNLEHLSYGLPKYLRTSGLKMRRQIDSLSKDILDSDYAQKGLLEGDIRDEITSNLGKYLRRTYKAFDDPDAYFGNERRGIRPSAEYIQARRDMQVELSENMDLTKQLYEDLVGPIPETGMRDQDIITNLMDTFVNKKRSIRSFKSMQNITNPKIARQKLNTEIFTKRKDDVLNALLGEKKDPFTTFITSTGDLAEFIAKDNFFKVLRSQVGRVETAGPQVSVGRGKDIIDGDVYARLTIDEKNKYVELVEPGLGSLRSSDTELLYAKIPVYNDLVRVVNNRNFATRMYSSFLRAKGFAQKVKTVYSPVTQVRNVISASLFAAANGNVGRGASVPQSVSLIFQNLRKTAPEQRADYYEMLVEEGVIGTQAQIREIDRLIEDGLDVASPEATRLHGAAPSVQQARNSYGQFLSNLGGLASKTDALFRNLYQGGDDIWKVYNFDFERSKILNVFGGDIDKANRFATRSGFKNLNAYAADIVKNTVPNYDRVPQFVQDIRRLPIGNFVAFPAEIVRTSTNIIKKGIDEMQLGRKLIQAGDRQAGEAMQAIGQRRLTGFASTVLVAGPAVQKTASYLTGVSADTIDALREIAAPWSQNSTLVPTSVDKDGNITGYMDYSYLNPYDYLKRPITGILNAIDDGRIFDLDSSEVAFNAGKQMVSELMSPFAEESLITERVLDVTTRGGQTKEGVRVWKPDEGSFQVESAGSKLSKSLLHIAGGFNPEVTRLFIDPGIDPQTTDIDFFKPGRLASAFGADQGIDPRGNVRQVGDEIFRLFTGITEQPVDPKTALMYRGLEFRAANRAPQSLFNSALRNALVRPLEPGKILDTYRKANERKYKIQNKMYRLINTLEKFGLSKSQIRKELRRQGVPSYKFIIRGKFDPVNIDNKLRNQINKAQRKFGSGERVPITELNRIEREYRRKKLTSGLNQNDTPLGNSGKQSFNFNINDFIPQTISTVGKSLPPNQTTVGPEGAASFPVAAPQGTSDTSVELLGDNPIDALKNLQIAQRQQ